MMISGVSDSLMLGGEASEGGGATGLPRLAGIASEGGGAAGQGRASGHHGTTRTRLSLGTDRTGLSQEARGRGRRDQGWP